LRQINKIDKWGWLKKTIPIFILAGLTVIFFSDILFQHKIFIHRDLSRFFYPLREFSANELLRLRMPLWNPYIHCGSPHLAELQTCVFYPLSAVYLLFPFPVAFNYFIVLHIFLAGLFVYMLMREWGYYEHACILSASVFMFSGYLISTINLLASLASVIWLPLVILFYERALKKDWVKNSIITGIFMAMMFLGGEPAILYATFFILIILSLILYSRERFQTVPYSGRRERCFLLAFLVFLGLAGFQVLPFLEFLKHTSRSSMHFNEASMWSLPPYGLIDLLVPYLSEADYLYKDYWSRQSWLLAYYMGICALIFAFIALRFDATKKRRSIFYIFALGLVLSFGRFTPLYYIFYNFFPGFKLSRYPVKFFFMVAFSLAILAGIGMDYYSKHAEKDHALRSFLKSFLWLGVIFSFIYLALNLNSYSVCDFLNKMLLHISKNLNSKIDNIQEMIAIGSHNIKRGIGLFMFLSVAMFLGARKKLVMSAICAFILGISAIDMFTANKNIYLNMDINEFLKPGTAIEFLQNDRSLFRIFQSPATLRQNMFVPEKGYFAGMSGLIERVVSDRGVSFGIYDAYGYGSLYNRRQEEIIDIIIRPNAPDATNLLSLLNVKYVISPKDFNADGYDIVRKSEKVNIYENKNVLPRAFLAEKAVVIKGEKKILEKMKTKEFIPKKEVILEEVLGSPSTSSGSFEQYSLSDRRESRAKPRDERSKQGLEESVNILKYKPNYVEIEAVIEEPKFLVLSDTYYPGWKVYVDKKLARIYKADYILRTVYLKPGKHIVKFIYEPFSFRIGTIITLGTIFIVSLKLKGK
jgi:hypothetical protein